LQNELQESSVSKLFSFPPQPPYSKTSHFLVSGLKKYLGIKALQCPVSEGREQISAGFLGSGFFGFMQLALQSSRLGKLFPFPAQPPHMKVRQSDDFLSK
jgi:hypothetical protein